MALRGVSALTTSRRHDEASAAMVAGGPAPAKVHGIPAHALIYLTPILIAPVAHNLITLGGAKPRWRGPFIAGAVGATAVAVGQRLYLLRDVGVPGMEPTPRR